MSQSMVSGTYFPGICTSVCSQENEQVTITQPSDVVSKELTSIISQTLQDPLSGTDNGENRAQPTNIQVGDLIGGKQPLPPDVVYKMQQRLYSSFISNDITNLVTYYLLGKHQQFNVSYANLQARVHSLYELIGKEKVVSTYDVQ